MNLYSRKLTKIVLILAILPIITISNIPSTFAGYETEYEEDAGNIDWSGLNEEDEDIDWEDKGEGMDLGSTADTTDEEDAESEFLDELPENPAPETEEQETQENPYDVEGLDSDEESTTEGEQDGSSTAGAAAEAGAEGDTEDSENGAAVGREEGEKALESFNVSELLTVPGEENEEGEETGGQQQRYLNETKESPAIDFILTIIDFMAKVAGTFSMIMIIIGGVFLLASEGDDNKIQKGKSMIVQAIIGLIIALTSYILVTFVQSLLYVQS